MPISRRGEFQFWDDDGLGDDVPMPTTARPHLPDNPQRSFTPTRLRWSANAVCLAIVVAATFALVPRSFAQHRPVLAVTVPSQESVSLFDVNGARLSLKKSVPVGKAPGRMCADAAGTTMFVGTASGIAAIDLATLAVTATMTDGSMKSLFGCVVSPDGRKLYAADRDANLVFVFSLPAHQLMKKIVVPEDPRNAIYTPDRKWLLVSCGDASAVAVIDPTTDAVSRTIKMPGVDPRSMAFTPDGKFLAVALVSSDIISWYRADTLEAVNAFGVTRSPQGLAMDPKGELLYVPGAVEGVIAVVDLREKNHAGVGEWRQANTIPVGPAYSIAISADGNYLYASPTGDTGTIVDLRTWKVLKPPVLKGAGTVMYIP
jgi:DNA-binding beta-propeller fold protein YncE